MKTTPRLIADFMPFFDTTFVVDTVEALSGNRYKLSSCHPSYGFVNGYASGLKIVEIGDNYIIVESSTVIVPGTYTLPTPTYLHGTQSAVSAKIAQTLKSNITFPFVFLQEIEEDTKVADRQSAIDRFASLRIWFLLDTKNGKEDTEDKHDRYITPMQRLADSFLFQIQQNSGFDEIQQDYKMTYFAEVGSSSDTAYLKNFLTTPMAGVFVRVSLPVNKIQCEC